MKNCKSIATFDKESFAITFKKRLKKARKAKYKTQDDFAEAISYSKDSVSKWESGATQPSYESLYKICDKLKIDPDYLLGFYDEKNYDTRRIKEMTGLSEKSIEMLNTKTFSKTISFLLEDNDFVKALYALWSIAVLLGINTNELKNTGNNTNVDIIRQSQNINNIKSNAQRYMANAIDNFVDHIEKQNGYPETLKQNNSDWYSAITRLSKDFD